MNISVFNSYFIATVAQIKKVNEFRYMCSVFKDSLPEAQDISGDDLALKLRNKLAFHLIRLLLHISHTEHILPIPGRQILPMRSEIHIQGLLAKLVIITRHYKWFLISKRIFIMKSIYFYFNYAGESRL